jgi:hypothetical protein
MLPAQRAIRSVGACVGPGTGARLLPGGSGSPSENRKATVPSCTPAPPWQRDRGGKLALVERHQCNEDHGQPTSR